MTATLFPDLMTGWESVPDGDAEARAIFHRHYSYRPYRDGRDSKLFCGPGSKLVLLSVDRKALFVWRRFISADSQTGVNCAVFRNEGAGLSSALILAAESEALRKWPDTRRFFTYVNAKKIRSSNPGACFKAAGWKTVGETKWNHLAILAKSVC